MNVPPRARTLGAASLAGGLLCLSVPPWGWWPLALPGLVLLERLVADRPVRQRFARAWLVAAALLFPSLSWMQSLTLPGYVIACIVYATMLGAGVAACPPGPGRWLALPGGLALAEVLRWSWPFGGVPLSNIAIGQVAGPLAPVLRIGSALGLLIVTVVLAMAVAAALRGALAPALFGAGAVVALVVLGVIAPDGYETDTIDVALVQGGGPQGTRAEETDERVVFDRHLAATEDVRLPLDLILWPENVVNVEGPVAATREGRELLALARSLDAPMVAGVVEGDGDRFHNSAVVIEPEGSFGDRFEKIHRVPFGEFVPFRSILERFAGDALISRDALVGEGPATLDTPVGRVGVAISWEVFFPERARDGISNGGRILLNPTNGASFTGTIVQTQQVASSRMRAIETGRWVLQAAPTGFTAIVGPDGTVVARSAISEATVLHATVGLREGNTIATRFGHWPAVAVALLCLAGGWAIERRRPVGA